MKYLKDMDEILENLVETIVCKLNWIHRSGSNDHPCNFYKEYPILTLTHKCNHYSIEACKFWLEKQDL